MAKLCVDRVVIVTGAGQGLGRAHVHELARLGARLIVNDITYAAEAVASEARELGGTAAAVIADVADWSQAQRLVAAAVETYGRLDALVNNAGLVRDRMLVTMSEQEWDAAVRVNLKGHFCPLRHAADHWRDRAKAGEPADARVVNTTSGAGLMGSIGQANYAAAKAGVATLTVQAAAELARYGVRVNAIAPAARTAMTEGPFAAEMRPPSAGFDAMDPANVSPVVAWLVSAESADVTGRVFEVTGGRVSVADGWQHGPGRDKQARWDAAELGPVVRELVAIAPEPAPVYGS